VIPSNPDIRSPHAVGWARALLVCLITGLGLAVMAGWTFHVPALLKVPTDSLPVVFDSGLCFFLCGISLSMAAMRAQPLAVRIPAAGVMLLSVATLGEIATGTSLGVDFPGLHAWYDYGNLRPGRMAPNTAAGFLLTSFALLVSTHVADRRRAILLLAATFAIFAIGITGLIGYVIEPDLLFDWARSARMVIPTAVGMLMIATAIWLSWRRDAWFVADKYIRADQLIRLFACSTLLVVALAAGLTGFALEQSVLHGMLEGRLETALRSRAALLDSTVREMEARAQVAAKLAGLYTDRGDERAGVAAMQLRAFRAAAALATGEGIRGVALLDADHRMIASAGTFRLVPEVVAPLRAARSSLLIWDRELVVRTLLPVAGRTIIVDQDARKLNEELFNPDGLGASAVVAACVSVPAGIECFPGRQYQAPMTMVPRAKGAAPLPMDLALAGKTGSIQTLDYHNAAVIAAYGTLGSGFGLVVKEKTVELYAPIRESLARGACIVGLVCAVGTAFLYLLLVPLVRRMRSSEESAREQELEMRTIVNAVGDGIFTADASCIVRSANAAAAALFGYRIPDLVGRDLRALMPDSHRQGQAVDAGKSERGPPARLVCVGTSELVGVKSDGSRFPLELNISMVDFVHGTLFVWVMRDISERKRVEKHLADLAQYDVLTGLPNRRLFDDRLVTAIQRAHRTGKPMSLLFLDLDGFKQVNDSFGHEIGDRLLIAFSERTRTCLRRTDTMGRLAGDEFFVILEDLHDPDCNPADIAAKIVDATAEPFNCSGNLVKIGVSIGVVVYDGQGTAPPGNELLIRADRQMYLAKRSGKNRYVIEVPAQPADEMRTARG